ncbi:MAG: hypothetical protein K8S94_04760 [Planctomycetia bacterium]|nr:hypothetical protein [Planctomycetia bacterium]
MITRHVVAEKIGAWLRHEISLDALVAWAEEALREEEFAEAESTDLAAVVARLGVADVKEFGLTWDDCEDLLKRIGFTAKVEITAA